MPTLSMTSAWSITAAVWPPRAAFVDHPLGHTTGRAGDPAGQRAIVEADAVVVRTLMTVTLSYDHRVVDGALGAILLGAFKTLIEDPALMMV